MKFLMSIAAIITCAVFGPLSVEARTIEVKAAGRVESVHAAIELADSGDTVRVAPGIYHESEITIDRSVTLLGIERPVLDADGKGSLINITAPGVTVSGFVFRNVPVSFVRENAAVCVTAARECEVSDNWFEANFFAIYLAKADHCRILRNHIHGDAPDLTNAGNAIHLWYCRDVAIVDNVIENHRDGIYLEFVKHSWIIGNTSRRNLRYGLHFMFSDSCRYENNRFLQNGSGVAVMYTTAVSMQNNVFADSWGGAAYGLLLKDIKNSSVDHNVFSGNSVGIHMEGSDHIDIAENRFVENGWAIRIMANCVGSTVHKNDFVDNSFQVATNSRQANSTFAENYWSTYHGYDLNHDGYGDEPYRPVSLYGLLVESDPSSLILVRSLLVDVLNLAERVVPTLTPETLVDPTPRMRPAL